MNDWRGVKLKLGDKVIYTVRHASTMTINEGEIVEFLEPDSSGRQRLKLKFIRGNTPKWNKRRYEVVTVYLHNVTMLGV